MSNEKFGKIIRIMAIVGLILAIFGIAFQVINAKADELDFVVKADLISCEKDNFNVQVTIENHGKDWEGLVRLIPDTGYYDPTAYDTTISLPQDSVKQFVMNIPRSQLDETNGTLRVGLINKKNKVEITKQFDRLLLDKSVSLVMGVLSDDYSSLTYLDMGGEKLYFHSEYFPVLMQDVTQGKFAEQLEGLTYLVIDNYDTSVLSKADIDALDMWIVDGGILVVGTGKQGEAVLKGLHDVLWISPEMQQAWTEEEVGVYSELPVYQMTNTLLGDELGQYQYFYRTEGLGRSHGDGAIMVLPFSLKDLGQVDFNQDFETQEEYVSTMLDEVSSMASSRYSSSQYSNAYDNKRYLCRMLGFLGHCQTNLHLGWLKFIVILYVIFVGPLLYVILMAMKKREAYWIAVPITALVGILLVFFVGRGFTIVDTEVFSVTVQDLSTKGQSKTTSYIYGYDANLSEWDLKLKSGYQFAGALIDDSHHYSSDEDDITQYRYRIQKAGEQIKIGLKPSSNFDDSYFYAGYDGVSASEGAALMGENLQYDYLLGVTGKVSNYTGQDIRYFAVIAPDDSWFVYEGLKNGETCDLLTKKCLDENKQAYNIASTYVYNFLEDLPRDKKLKNDIDILSALGVGMCSSYYEAGSGKFIIVGVTETAEDVVDDRCKEASYGCFYSVQ